MELALLWQTLGILKSIGNPRVLESFYEDLLCSINEIDPLSLTDFTDNGKSSFDTCNILEGKAGIQSLLLDQPLNAVRDTSVSQQTTSVAENSDSEVDKGDESEEVVQKLFNSAESLAFTLHPSDRCLMYSVCLALAVKSGRLSLLLQSAGLLFSNDKKEDSITAFKQSYLKILIEIVDFISMRNRKDEQMKIAIYKTGLLQLSHKENLSQSMSIRLQDSGIKESSDELDFISHRLSHSHQPPSNRVTLSFGKADHGKLGLGDSQVLYIMRHNVVILLSLVYNTVLSKLFILHYYFGFYKTVFM
jgi:hypothetical protein